MSDSTKLDDLITVDEAAEMRGVSRSAIRDLIRRNRIRRIDRFGRTLVYRSDIENYQTGKAGRPPKTPHTGDDRQ